MDRAWQKSRNVFPGVVSLKTLDFSVFSFRLVSMKFLRFIAIEIEVYFIFSCCRSSEFSQRHNRI